MTKQTLAKQERIVEAVRLGLEGDAAVEFLHQGGFAIAVPVLARHLRKMGGRGKVQELIVQGLPNQEILSKLLTPPDTAKAKEQQPELFSGKAATAQRAPSEDSPLYSTRKMTMTLPSELYEAVRAAAQGENKTQNQLIVDLLTSALSRMPEHLQQEFEEL